MQLISHLRKSFRSLLIHRLRTLLSTLGILFGVVAVVAMLSIGEGAKRETLEQIEQLGMNSIVVRQSPLSEDQHLQARERRSQGLTIDDAIALQKGVPSLLAQAPVKNIEASLTGTLQNRAPEIIAVTRAYAEIKELKPIEGRFICDIDHHDKKLVCVLGYDVANALGAFGHIGKTVRIENSPFEIVGVLQPSEWKASKNSLLATRNVNETIFIPLGAESALSARTNLKSHTLSEIILQMKQSQNTVQTASIIKGILRRSHAGYEDYQVIIPQELLNQAQQTQQTFNLVLGSIAAISLLVGGIGIMNIMLANVSERVREIGIRRAMGATQKDIMFQFLTETLLLTFIGALLGVLLGVLFSLAISYFAGWKTIVTLWSIILSLAMSGGVGVCSGLYPAYQAATLNPIVALRRE